MDGQFPTRLPVFCMHPAVLLNQRSANRVFCLQHQSDARNDNCHPANGHLDPVDHIACADSLLACFPTIRPLVFVGLPTVQTQPAGYCGYLDIAGCRSFACIAPCVRMKHYLAAWMAVLGLRRLVCLLQSTAPILWYLYFCLPWLAVQPLRSAVPLEPVDCAKYCPLNPFFRELRFFSADPGEQAGFVFRILTRGIVLPNDFLFFAAARKAFSGGFLPNPAAGTGRVCFSGNLPAAIVPLRPFSD